MHSINKLMVIILTLAAFVGCQSQKVELVVNTSPVTFPAEGGTKSIALTANFDWAAVVEDNEVDWLTIKDGVGKPSENPQSFTVVADKNEGAERSTVITIAMLGTSPVHISVTQKAGPSDIPSGPETDDPVTPPGTGGEGEGGGNEEEDDDKNYIYLDPWEWISDNARMAAYFFGDAGNTWVSMEASGSLFRCAVPEGYTNVIFCRMNPKFTENGWNSGSESDEDKKVWNQTDDLVIPTDGKNLYVLNGWGSGWGQNCTGSWSTYTGQ